jgi:glycosyltransferase involved in cell wall biosynthesis
MQNTPKSILFFNPTGMIGGAEVNLLTMIEGLQRNGHHCTVVVPYHGPLSKRLDELKCKTYLVKEESILHGDPKHIITGLWQLRKIIKGVDIIHSNSRFSLYLPLYAGWFFRKKVVIHWADYDILTGDRQLLNLRSKHVTIIAVSKSIKEYLMENGVRDEMITVIHNGCDEPTITQEANTIRQKYHIAPSQPVIAISGRIDSWKGHKTLLNAVSKIRNPNLVVLILGEFHLAKDPNLKDDILQLIASLSLYDSVIFTGFLENPANVLQCCDIT